MSFSFALQLFVIVVAILIFQNTCGQSADHKNRLVVSAPVIWNSTTIYNRFSGARATDLSGDAVSHGAHLRFDRKVSKKIFVAFGAGLFTQKFGITRPFLFDDPTRLLFHTEWYKYSNYHYLAGIGYTVPVFRKYDLRVLAAYNSYHSYKQQYKPTYLSNASFQETQLNRLRYKFGEVVMIEAGLSRRLNNQLGVGLNILLPVHTKWRKDEVFKENPNEHYSSRFSIGSSIDVYYSF